MKQIYNFEQHRPPILNENMIRAEIDRRKLHLQTTLLVPVALSFVYIIALHSFTV